MHSVASYISYVAGYNQMCIHYFNLTAGLQLVYIHAASYDNYVYNTLS